VWRSYLEEILHCVGMIVVGQSERGRFELWNARCDVARQAEQFNVVMIQHGGHAGRDDHDDSVARCTKTHHHAIHGAQKNNWTINVDEVATISIRKA